MLSDAQQELFTRLWTAVQPAVAGYIRALVRDDPVADDLTQETALVLLRTFSSYDPQRPFLPWALNTAKFQILGHRRDEARCRVLFDGDLLDRITENWGDAAPQISGEQAALGECLETLAPHARKLLRLRYDETLDSTQIARQLATTAAAVRMALQRAREQLRVCVERRLQIGGGTA